MKAQELGEIMNNAFGHVSYAGIDVDPWMKYPKGTYVYMYSQLQANIVHTAVCIISNIHSMPMTSAQGFPQSPPPHPILCSVTAIFVRIKIYNIIVLSVEAILIIIHHNIHSDSLPPAPLFFFLGETLHQPFPYPPNPFISASIPAQKFISA